MPRSQCLLVACSSSRQFFFSFLFALLFGLPFLWNFQSNIESRSKTFLIGRRIDRKWIKQNVCRIFIKFSHENKNKSLCQKRSFGDCQMKQRNRTIEYETNKHSSSSTAGAPENSRHEVISSNK